jgi:hypothetical protein
MHPDPPTFREWLGDIDTEALFQNLKNYNPNANPIDVLRLGFPHGFTVIAHWNADHSELFGLELLPQEESARKAPDAA